MFNLTQETDNYLLELEREVLSDYADLAYHFNYQPYGTSPLIIGSESFRDTFYDYFGSTYSAYSNYIALDDYARPFSDLDEDEREMVDESVFGLGMYESIDDMVIRTLNKYNVFYLYEESDYMSNETEFFIGWINSPLQEVW